MVEFTRDGVLGLRVMIEFEEASLEREVGNISEYLGKMSDVVARLRD